tara:strand:+ start:314 stop:415 length:102 start_codon:yes stop_codon:yes gene_type:complete
MIRLLLATVGAPFDPIVSLIINALEDNQIYFLS